jgi:predicted ArsR family transcriptional regulator
VFESREDYAEPLTASEIADRLGCSRRTALNKLHDLEDETDLESKKVGGRSRVWWIPVNV